MRTQGIARAVLRAICVVVLGVAVYFVAALVLGLVPVNRNFVAPADGIEIFLVTNGVHAGLALPLTSRAGNLDDDMPAPEGFTVQRGTYVLVGWGDSRIYPQTGTWGDLTVGNAVSALFGLNGALMHVEHVHVDREGGRPPPSAQFLSTRVSDDGYRRLLTYVRGSLKRDGTGRAIRLAGASHGRRDAFFLAYGRYQPFFTCNEWVRAALSAAGVRTASWSPFDIALFRQFPRHEGGG